MILKNVKATLKRRTALKNELAKIDKMLAPFMVAEVPASASAGASGKRPKRTWRMSEAVKAKLSKAAKARWKKVKAAGKKGL